MIILAIRLKGKVIRRTCYSQADVESWLEAGWDEAFIQVAGQVFQLVETKWVPSREPLPEANTKTTSIAGEFAG